MDICIQEPDVISLENHSMISRSEIIKNLEIDLTSMLKYQPLKNYMESIQKSGMSPSWRRRICNWMVEAANDFEMNVDTVAAAINYMDRYLSVFSADRVLLQLLSMVSLYVSSKMFETQPMSMNEVENLSRGKFSKKDIKDLELQLLRVLDWKVNPPTAHIFSRSLIFLMEESKERDAILYDTLVILDLCLKEYAFVQFSPATIALASVNVASIRQGFKLSPLITCAVNQLPWITEDIVNCQNHILIILSKGSLTLNSVGIKVNAIGKPSKIFRYDSPTSVNEIGNSLVHMECSASVEMLEVNSSEECLAKFSLGKPTKKRSRTDVYPMNMQ